MDAVGLLAGADEGLGLGEAALDGQRDEGRAGGRVTDGDSGGSAVLLLVVGAGGDGAVEDAGHICHESVLFNVAPWGLNVAGRDRVGRAVDTSDTPFHNTSQTRRVFVAIPTILLGHDGAIFAFTPSLITQINAAFPLRNSGR